MLLWRECARRLGERAREGDRFPSARGNSARNLDKCTLWTRDREVITIAHVSLIEISEQPLHQMGMGALAIQLPDLAKFAEARPPDIWPFSRCLSAVPIGGCL